MSTFCKDLKIYLYKEYAVEYVPCIYKIAGWKFTGGFEEFKEGKELTEDIENCRLFCNRFWNFYLEVNKLCPTDLDEEDIEISKSHSIKYNKFINRAEKTDLNVYRFLVTPINEEVE